MNVSMWLKAVRTIPRISKEEWDGLDVISRWLIATRSAVLVMTLISAGIAGLLAAKAGLFNGWNFSALTLGLLFAHATNNMLNDMTDYRRGVDKDNYFRTMYGPQPLEQGLMSERSLLTYVGVTGALAVVAGLFLVLQQGWMILALMAVGAFFVLFYTWPLKYIGMGELAVILVWGPLMVGGGYFAITGLWSWNVCIASLPFALAVTSVIFGKHIDKLPEDKAKGIHTLPVLIGEKAGRYIVYAMFALMYLTVVYLVIIRFFSPWMLLVFLTLYWALPVLKIYSNPRPAERPAEFSQEVWPLWFVAAAFYHTRLYGTFFVIGLILSLIF
ncbi:MAG TPA: prenyltransferase [Longilinea sp.]|nr:prenyltransferase [Longilinea sp.]